MVEILAVELGHSHAMELGCRDVICLSDCLQLTSVLQTNIDVACFWDRDAFGCVRSTMGKLQRCHLQHIERDKNNTTNQLAREAAREGSHVRIWRNPPSSVYAWYLDAS